uniref:Uncharacterized protein n=1 Tax=Candidatus Kentrum eta TaxID=2126337 RepID=A0A450VHF3_9GAMM|nr:MAG: hypothetical protein BECKH772B_GA0070898_103844 [Candidatus Kentron sp. H]VFK04141.1 MAG: hypothetical protein BECKH772A_GA0070896_103854 [Candidatus Kentron sp. H]VFK06818.1 MAG: hypothetical protein BECKH772C_GA0070978_103754 [Candidatus Kentron sp. H]
MSIEPKKLFGNSSSTAAAPELRSAALRRGLCTLARGSAKRNPGLVIRSPYRGKKMPIEDFKPSHYQYFVILVMLLYHKTIAHFNGRAMERPGKRNLERGRGR